MDLPAMNRACVFGWTVALNGRVAGGDFWCPTPGAQHPLTYHPVKLIIKLTVSNRRLVMPCTVTLSSSKSHPANTHLQVHLIRVGLPGDLDASAFFISSASMSKIHTGNSTGSLHHRPDGIFEPRRVLQVSCRRSRAYFVISSNFAGTVSKATSFRFVEQQPVHNDGDSVDANSYFIYTPTHC